MGKKHKVINGSITSKAMKAELLDAETELELARNWYYNQCEQSLHRLVNAYMRLAIQWPINTVGMV